MNPLLSKVEASGKKSREQIRNRVEAATLAAKRKIKSAGMICKPKKKPRDNFTHD